MSPTPAAGGDGSDDRLGHGAPDGDVFRRLNLQAWQRNRDRARRLTEVVAELGDGASEAPGPPRRPWAMARTLAHEIVGSAGTFGHPHASELARRIEELLAPAPQLSAAALAELTPLAARVEQALASEPSVDGH